jgi:LysM repeat protein
MHPNLRISVVVVLCAVLLLPALASADSEAMPPAQSGELLKNPGLDGPMWFKSQCCGEDGLPINEVQIAEGWTAWWLPTPPAWVVPPNNCEHKALWGCYWMRPEFVDSARTLQPNRIRSGDNSQKYFSFGRMHEAGLYQRVTGITPGARLRFTVFMHAWMCIDPADCNAGYRSDNPTTMHMRVGIDPLGGTDAFSPNIVWSGEMDSFDHWAQYAVEAVAQSGSVTVFTHSRPEWEGVRMHNDVYVDDASLVQVGTGAVVPQQASQPTATAVPAQAATPAASAVAPTKAPVITPSPRPDGAVVHVVQAGDTLSGISAQYNVPLDELYKLNGLTSQSIIAAGQEIVVKVGTLTPVPPTPTSAPTQAPAATPTPPPPPTAMPVQGGLCLGAFDDANNNTVRDGGEASLAGVTFVVLSGGSQAASYTTDGASQPNCLTQLSPGSYSVQITLPSGYVAALDKTDLTLVTGQRTDLIVAARRGEKAAPTLAAATSAPAKTPARSNTGLIAGVVAVVAILILGAVAVFVIQRRQ